MKLLIMDINWN